MEEPLSPYPLLKKKNSSQWPILMVVIIGAVFIGGFVMSRQSKKETVNSPIVTEITRTPSPTEMPKIDKKAVKIKVENGTGTPGQAGLVVKSLEEAGYETDNIKTGNAETYDHTDTSISSKESHDEIVKDIKGALKSTFEDITEGVSNLKSDDEFDVIIITGGKLFPTDAPLSSTTSATLTPSPSLSPTP